MTIHQTLKYVLVFSAAILSLILAKHPQSLKAQSPFDLTLTWSTNSFVPPNYPAKPLPTQGSRIEVVALTNQETSGLQFKWKLDNAWQNFASGLGRDTLSFVASQWPGYSHRVYLELSYPGVEGEQILAEASIDIPIVSPEVYLYETRLDQLWPHLVKAIDSQTNLLAGTTTYFLALPFFFNIQNSQELTYRWYLAGEDAIISNPNRPQLFDLEITPQTQSGVKQQLMLKCFNEKNLSERKTLKIDVVVD